MVCFYNCVATYLFVGINCISILNPLMISCVDLLDKIESRKEIGY